jgi:hypothetical protein
MTNQNELLITDSQYKKQECREVSTSTHIKGHLLKDGKLCTLRRYIGRVNVLPPLIHNLAARWRKWSA